MKIEPRSETVQLMQVSGITVRTSNKDEVNQETAQISNLWHKFVSENLYSKIPHLLSNTAVYGVYYNYASDVNDDYDVMAGAAVSAESDQPNFKTIAIQPGKYLVFDKKGVMPRAVIDAWQAVWTYLQQHPRIERQYQTDFEVYKNSEEVAIYIGIK